MAHDDDADIATVGTRPWLMTMRFRDVGQLHRVSTPLELLFDLTFVVAVAQVAAELAHGIADAHVAPAVVGYLTVFFAIWWAWMNFTWFASAYDTDDVPYRLLTLVQMVGVQVLAAGVPAAFETRNFTAVTIGYVIMRVAMVTQWARAAYSDPVHRTTALRYATGTAVVQLGWVLRLFVPGGAGLPSFLLVVAELLVPWWAERANTTTWHPHHIAERYGLFTIIVLGECVFAATVAVQATVVEGGWSVYLLLIGAGSLVLVFALWWLYFLKPAGAGLERRRDLAFLWGYGHYGIFAAVAALGAGLETATEAVGHHITASNTLVVAAIAVPVVVFLLLVWGLHVPLGAAPSRQLVRVVATAAGCVVVVVLTAAGLPVPAAVLAMAVPPAVLVAVAVRADHRTVGVSDGI